MRALPWILVAVLFLAFAASFSELQRMRTRFGEVSRHQFHDHADVRSFMIKAALVDAKQPIVILGDSITEMAPLPRQLCGHPVINAGIGGQTIKEAKQFATDALDERGAFLIVLAIGANDVVSTTVRSDFLDLIDGVRPLSARPLLAIAVAPDLVANQRIRDAAIARGVPFIDPQLPQGSKLPDGIHYSAVGYALWVPTLEAAITKECA